MIINNSWTVRLKILLIRWILSANFQPSVLFRRVNGHEPDAIYQAVKRGEAQRERPVAVILDTVKGKGIPYFENMENSHHIRANDEQNRIIEKIMITLEEKEVRA